jgi:HD superfamily phosphodiesterase
MDNIVKSASEFVTKLLKENLSSEYTYHNLQHAGEVFSGVTEIGENSNISNEELEVIQVAALFHDTGFTKGYLDHEFKSAEIAKEYLENINYPRIKIEKITEIIVITTLGNIPANLLEMIIKDADNLHVGKEDFYSNSLLLKSEWETFEYRKYTHEEWLQSSLDFLNRTAFFTEYANSKYDEGRQKNIFLLNEMIKNHNDFLLTQN